MTENDTLKLSELMTPASGVLEFVVNRQNGSFWRASLAEYDMLKLSENEAQCLAVMRPRLGMAGLQSIINL